MNILKIATVACLLSAGSVNAATLTATFDGDFTTPSFDGASDGETAFQIVFDDTLGSMAGVLEGVEFTSFSWINNPFTFGGSSFREVLANAPTIAGVVQTFRPTGFVGTPNPATWAFGQGVGSGSQSTASPSAFTYSISGVGPTPVPLPAGLPLLAAALGLLGWFRRRA